MSLSLPLPRFSCHSCPQVHHVPCVLYGTTLIIAMCIPKPSIEWCKDRLTISGIEREGENRILFHVQYPRDYHRVLYMTKWCPPRCQYHYGFLQWAWVLIRALRAFVKTWMTLKCSSASWVTCLQSVVGLLWAFIVWCTWMDFRLFLLFAVVVLEVELYCCCCWLFWYLNLL